MQVQILYEAQQAEGASSNLVSRSIWELSSNFVYLYIIDVNEITKSKWYITNKMTFATLESNLVYIVLERNGVLNMADI